MVDKGKGGGRVRKAEEELDMPLVMKVKHEPKIILTVEQVEKLLQKRWGIRFISPYASLK